MDFQHILKDASAHFRYQEKMMEHMFFPEPCFKYSFTLHAITKDRFHYPCGISFTALSCYAMLYTISGTAVLRMNKENYPLTAESIIWIDCQHGFDIEITETRTDWDFVLLFISGNTMPNYYADYNKNGKIVINCKHSPVIPSTLHQIYSHVISKPDGSLIIFSKLLCDLVTAMVLDRFIQTQYGEVPQHIIQIIQYIHKHYQEKITLDSIASCFARSKFGLCRDFTAYMNQSLIDYLIDYRIEKSRKLLTCTNLSISEIAANTGFSSVNNYIFQFKKRTDETPTSYRRQNQIYSSMQSLSDHDKGH